MRHPWKVCFGGQKELSAPPLQGKSRSRDPAGKSLLISCLDWLLGSDLTADHAPSPEPEKRGNTPSLPHPTGAGALGLTAVGKDPKLVWQDCVSSDTGYLFFGAQSK